MLECLLWFVPRASLPRIQIEQGGGGFTRHRRILQVKLTRKIIEEIIGSSAGELSFPTIMPRTLQKVHKHISKKRGVVDSLHENSRDAQRLRRAGARDERLTRHAAISLRARQPYSTFSRDLRH